MPLTITNGMNKMPSESNSVCTRGDIHIEDELDTPT
jgi:hypothetical protein